MFVTDAATDPALTDLADAADRLRHAADAAAERLAANQAEREDDIAIATLAVERRRTLSEAELIEFDEMARRVGVDLDALP